MGLNDNSNEVNTMYRKAAFGSRYMRQTRKYGRAVVIWHARKQSFSDFRYKHYKSRCDGYEEMTHLFPQ